VTTEFCKKCKSPNPQFVYTQQTAAYANNPQYDGYSNQQNYNQQNYAPQNYNAYQPQPDFSAPPPPNAFGNSAGTANYNQNQQNYYQHQYYQQTQSLSPDEQRELDEAKKQIKNAWIGGVILCVISLIVSVIWLGNSRSEEAIAEGIGLLIFVVIMGGLTLGVYFKSRACAVIICSLYALDKILTFASGNKTSGIIGFIIFMYYFIYRIKRTFTNYLLTKGRR